MSTVRTTFTALEAVVNPNRTHVGAQTVSSLLNHPDTSVGAAAHESDPWHLFTIVVDHYATGRPARHRTFLVSAQSGSQEKAKELAHNAVEDWAHGELGEDDWTMDIPKYVCTTDRDVWQEV